MPTSNPLLASLEGTNQRRGTSQKRGGRNQQNQGGGNQKNQGGGNNRTKSTERKENKPEETKPIAVRKPAATKPLPTLMNTTSPSSESVETDPVTIHGLSNNDENTVSQYEVPLITEEQPERNLANRFQRNSSAVVRQKVPRVSKKTGNSTLDDWAEKYRTFCEDAAISQKHFFCKYDPDNDTVMRFERDATNKDVVLPTCQFQTLKPDFVDQRRQSLEKLARLERRITGFYNLASENADLECTPKEHTKLLAIEKNIHAAAEKINSKLTICLAPLYINSYAGLVHLTEEICEPLDSIVDMMEAAIFPALFKYEEIVAVVKQRTQLEKDEESKKSVAGRVFGFARAIGSAITYGMAGIGKLVRAVRTVFNYLYLNGLPGLKRFISVAATSLGTILSNMCDVTIGEETEQMTKRAILYSQIEGILIATLPDKDSYSAKTFALLKNFVTLICGPKTKKFLKYMIGSVKNLMSSLMDQAPKIIEGKKSKRSDQTSVSSVQVVVDIANSLLEKIKSNEVAMTTKTIRDVVFMCCVFGFEQICSLFSYIGSTVCQVSQSKLAADFSDKLKSYFLANNENDDFHDPDEVVEEKQTQDKTEKGIFARRNRLAAQEAKLERIRDKEQLREVPNVTFKNTGNTTDEKSRSEKVASLILPLIQFVWFFSRNNIIPADEIEDDLTEYATEEAYKKIQTKIANLKLPKVPKYIRYGYCLAQGNDATTCQVLAEDETSDIHATSTSDTDYALYTKAQQAAYEQKQRKLVNLSQADIQKDIIARVLAERKSAPTKTK